eukprot:3367609-Pyramimonas_sp.AAC.1
MLDASLLAICGSEEVCATDRVAACARDGKPPAELDVAGCACSCACACSCRCCRLLLRLSSRSASPRRGGWGVNGLGRLGTWR